MKRFLFIVLIVSACFPARAQYRPYYSWAFGFRAGSTGGTSGLSVKGFIGETLALEGVIGYWHGAPAGTLLLEKYIPAFRTKGLNWFFGGGAHYTGSTGFSRWYIVDNRGYDYVEGGAGYGIDAIAGIEYKIPAAPVAFSIDLKPFVEFSDAGGFAMAVDPGVGVKLAF
jgi:hypothetical protein